MKIKTLHLPFLILLFSSINLFAVSNSLFDFFQKRYIDTINIRTISNAIIVPVIIEDKSYNFIFDTGASTSVSNEIFQKLKLPINDSCLNMDYYGNFKKINESILPEFVIGKTKFTNVRISIIRPIQDLMFCNLKIDGCLGNDFLSKGAVQIDIQNKRLIISSSIKFLKVDKVSSIDFETNQQEIPFLTIKFPGLDCSEKVMFDTGSSNYFYRLKKSTFLKMLSNGHIKNKNILDTLGPEKNGSALFGKQNEKEIYFVNFDSINFINNTIYNVPSYTFSSGYFSILGSPFLQLGVITLDYKGHKFYFRSYNKKKIDLRPIHGFTWTSNKHSQLVVETVLDNSIAKEKGIKNDYILKKLNSISLDSLTLCDRANFDWSKEFHMSIVKYVFMTKENREIEIEIEK